MARNARCIWPGLAYHVTQRGSNRQRVFFSRSDRQFYLALLRENLTDCGTRVLAYCLMSNHVHVVLVPGQADSLAVLLRRVHGRYAQYLNVKKQRSGHLWQNRYFSCPLSDSHLGRVLRYVEHNPVRACLARQPGSTDGPVPPPIWASTHTGRPFGDETFVERLEERFGRNRRRWSFEATLFPGKFAPT